MSPPCLRRLVDKYSVSRRSASSGISRQSVVLSEPMRTGCYLRPTLGDRPVLSRNAVDPQALRATHPHPANFGWRPPLSSPWTGEMALPICHAVKQRGIVPPEHPDSKPPNTLLGGPLRESSTVHVEPYGDTVKCVPATLICHKSSCPRFARCRPSTEPTAALLSALAERRQPEKRLKPERCTCN